MSAAELQVEFRRLRDHWQETGEGQYAVRQAYNDWFHQSCLEGNPPDALRLNAGSEEERFFARTIPGLDGHTYWDGKPENGFRLDAGGRRNARWWWYEHVHGAQARGSLGPVCGEPNCITPEHQRFVPWSLAKRRYTDEQMLGALQVVAAQLGHTPTRDEYEATRRKPSSDIIAIRFGGWTKAVRSAGLVPASRGVADLEQCFAALRFAANLIGHAPSETEFRAHNRELQAAGLHSSPSTIYRCTGSWPKALKLAGLTERRGRNPEDAQATRGAEES